MDNLYMDKIHWTKSIGHDTQIVSYRPSVENAQKNRCENIIV